MQDWALDDGRQMTIPWCWSQSWSWAEHVLHRYTLPRVYLNLTHVPRLSQISGGGGDYPIMYGTLLVVSILFVSRRIMIKYVCITESIHLKLLLPNPHTCFCSSGVPEALMFSACGAVVKKCSKPVCQLNGVIWISSISQPWCLAEGCSSSGAHQARFKCSESFCL